MRSLSLALLSTTAVLLTTGLASAQSVDDAGARALETQVPALLDYLFSSNPDIRYTFNGDIAASPEGDSYSLAVPELTLSVDRDVDIALPAFDADVTPLENGWQRAEWDLTGPIIFTNPRDDDDRAEVTFTSEDNMMTFAPEYGMALISDLSANDLTVLVDGMEGALTLDSLAMSVDSEPSGDGPDSYDLRTGLAVEALLLDVPQEEVRVEIGSFEMHGDTEGQQLDLFAMMQERMQGLDPESTAFAETLIEIVREFGNEVWMAGAEYSTEINDLSFAIEDVTGQLGSAVFASTFEDLDQPNIQVGWTIDVQDVSSPDIPPLFADIVPSAVHVDVAAVDAPLKAVLDEVRAVLGQANEAEYGPKGRRAGTGGSGLEALQSLDPMVFLGLLLQSDALLQINDLNIEAPIGYLTAEGTIDPEPSAAFQAVADVSLDIAGLPEMISFAQRMGGDAAQAAGLASAIAAMGRDGTDENGTAIKEFDFQLTAAGQMLLNGNDLSAMMGMFQ